MGTNKPQGFFGRGWKAIKRFILNKSDPSYLAELVGDERCFERAIAAQLGWPGVKSQKAHDPLERDPVDKAPKESFPASDPPPRSGISTIGPVHQNKPAA